MSHSLGLFLSGGGSRAAYQVGVLKGILELDPQCRFRVIVGFSAGAINAGYLASEADDFRRAVLGLERLWSQLEFKDVIRSDLLFFIKRGIKLLWDLSFGGIHRSSSIESLLDSSPLRRLLFQHLACEKIQHHLDQNHLRSVGVCATDYGSGDAVTFYQDRNEFEPWRRQRRESRRVQMTVDHIMASSAIPMLFPSVQIGDGYYGDGLLRNTAPLSPAIHLGADSLLIIGVRRRVPDSERKQLLDRPRLGRVLGSVLNALILDQTDADIERLDRINRTISHLSEESRKKMSLRSIPYLWMSPSVDLGELASAYVKDLPVVLRYLLRGLGKKEDFSDLVSYLLFHPRFCQKLMEIGRQDVLDRRDDVLRFLRERKSEA